MRTGRSIGGSSVKHFSTDYARDYHYYLKRPPPRPRISGAGTGCADDRCLWIKAYNPGSAPCIDIRRADGSSAIIDQYCRGDITFAPGQPAVITLRLRTRNGQHQELVNRGLYVWVTNVVGGVWSDRVHVRASR